MTMRTAYRRILFVTDGEPVDSDGPMALGLPGRTSSVISSAPLLRAPNGVARTTGASRVVIATPPSVPALARPIAEAARRAAADLVVLGPCASPDRSVLARLAIEVQREEGRELPVAILGGVIRPAVDDGAAVLAAIDGGDETPEVLKAGLRLANTARAQLVVVHVGVAGPDSGADLLVRTVADEYGVRGVRMAGIVIHDGAPVPQQLASVADRIGAIAIVLGWNHRSPEPGAGVVGQLAGSSSRPLLLAPAATRRPRIHAGARPAPSRRGPDPARPLPLASTAASSTPR